MIKRMKRILFVILAVFVAVCFAGCGEYVYAPNRPSGDTTQGGGSHGGSQGGNENDDPNGGSQGGNQGNRPGSGNPDDEEEEVRVFTVTLVKNGVIYTNTDGIEAQWVSRYGVYTAEFVDGVATIEGLDGEYHVTLSQLPQEKGKEYTYDCNGYIANNNKRNIKIELLEILTANPGLNGWIEVRELGTYRVTISGSNKEVLYYYFPQSEGWYSITSWVDTSENKVNPKVNIYNGNAFSGFKALSQTKDEGGTKSTYTKNFRFEVKINWDEVGNNQIFGVMADSAKGYPVTVDFTVKYEGEYIRQDFGEPIYANGPFLKTKPNTGSFSYAYKDDRIGNDSFGNAKYKLDGSKVKLKESGEGAGFYHLYDEVKYASNGGYGPMLFAMIGHDTELIWTYTLDIRPSRMDGGFTANTTLGGGVLSLISGGYDYAFMISNSKDEDGNQHIGYVNYLNADGTHPVNEELKQFLQAFAMGQLLFDDGEGWAENSELNTIRTDTGAVQKPGICLQSSESDQWLFACGYYK